MMCPEPMLSSKFSGLFITSGLTSALLADYCIFSPRDKMFLGLSLLVSNLIKHEKSIKL